MVNPIIGSKLSEIVAIKNRLIEHYKKLEIIARNKIDRERISSIIDEEIKHINMIKSICARILGNQLPVCSEGDIERDYVRNFFEKIIALETNVIRVTKSLILSISDIRIKNGLYYILTDDQRHTDIIIFLCIKYS